MTKKRKAKKKGGTSEGFIGRLFSQTKLPAHVTEEQDWYLDTPDVRLTRVFTIVLILHVVAVGGILAFKMVEKASGPSSIVSTIDDAASPASPSEEKSKPADDPSPASAAEAPSGAMKAGLVMDHPSAPGYQQYRVAAGDNLVGIARELKLSAAELRDLNQLSEGDRLMPGRWLLFPKKASSPASASEKKPAETKIAEAKADATPASKPGPEIREIKKAPVPKPAPKPAPVTPKPITTIAKAPTPAPAPAPKPAPASSAKKGDSYQVKPGDTFFGIARQFGIHYKELMAANGIDKAEHLQAGMTLQIPVN